MMALRGVRQTARRQMPARRLVWSRSIKSESAATSGAYDLLEDFRLATQYGAQPLGTTVTRVRGYLVLSSPSVTTPTGITWGLVVEDRAAAVAEVPKPQQERHVDWLAWQPHPHVGTDGITGTANAREIDVRSQRKLDEVGQTLWLAWDQTSATVTWTVAFSLSVLLKLP
jgi:hypothetical protein